MTADAIRIGIVGGGISGLAAAFRLTEIAPHATVRLFEQSDRLGGLLQTTKRDGFLFECSGDMFTTTEPWAIRLCERLGFEQNLIGTNREHRRAFVVSRGRLVSVPMGFSLMTPTRIWPMIRTPVLSIAGKLRMACEFFIPPKKDDSDESLAAFARRRLGREAYERIVQPLVGGIYTADPEKLSMAAALQRFRAMECEHGGLIRATLARRSRSPAPSGQHPDSAGVRYGEFVTPRDGMSSLINALSQRLPPASIALNTAVQRVERLNDGRWRVVTESRGATDSSEEFDRLILATPVSQTARLLQPICPEAAEPIAGIALASAAVVVAAYRKRQLSHPLDGFGFVVPLVEHRRILAGSFASIKFAGRAPDDSVLLRVFVGGAIQPELLQLPDDAIYALVEEELRQLLGVQGPPTFRQLIRWNDKMPQYHVGHNERITRFEQALAQVPTLQVAGNAYRGVGIPFCIRSGEQAAEASVAPVSSFAPRK